MSFSGGGSHRDADWRAEAKVAAKSPPFPGSLTEPPRLRLPDPGTLFQDRAERFRSLAKNHSSLAGYLTLMADLAEIQHVLSGDFPPASPPDSAIDNPPELARLARSPAWRGALRQIALRMNPWGGAVAGVTDRIQKSSDEEMELWADGLLALAHADLDSGLSPFVAAALQLQWTATAARLDAKRLMRQAFGSLCPVCGFHPVAGILQTGGAVQGLRYLVCGLCASEWNRVRIHCASCGSSKDVAYFGIEGAEDAVRAEACGSCGTYLKLMSREKDPQLDPAADDLATLALDILMAEEGYHRLGLNLLLVPGD